MDEMKLTNENAADSSSENKIRFANFGDRFIARFIDTLLTGIVGYLIISNRIDSTNPILIPTLILVPGFFIYHLLYSPIMESLGGTFGKKIAKIRTINIQTNKAPSIGQTFMRTAIIIVPMFFVFLLSTQISKSMSTDMQLDAQGHLVRSSINPSVVPILVFTVYILPFLAMLYSPTKQCWHDKFSKVAVLKL